MAPKAETPRCGWCLKPAAYRIRTADPKAIPRRHAISCDTCRGRATRWVAVTGKHITSLLEHATVQLSFNLDGGKQ